MNLFFDLDGTLCRTVGNHYSTAQPIRERIDVVNQLYDLGNRITIYTARGMTTYAGNVDLVNANLYDMTLAQLQKWNIKFTQLIMGKPSYDFFIDDKAIDSEKYFGPEKRKSGLIAGSFDIIHPGYMQLFEDAKSECGYLIVALHEDPSLDRSEKHKPIFSLEERMNILGGIKYVDKIIPYVTENDLIEIINKENVDIRFAGDDYKEKHFTGKELSNDIIYLDRSHGWSTTKVRRMIYDAHK